MTNQQLARMSHLADAHSLTAAENVELANLERLHRDMCEAFKVLDDRGMSPTWVGGEYIVAIGRVIRNLADAKTLAVLDLSPSDALQS